MEDVRIIVSNMDVYFMDPWNQTPKRLFRLTMTQGKIDRSGKRLERSRELFLNLAFLFVDGDANQAAHLCVKQASSTALSSILLSDCNLVI
jgi:hypothetical protein